MKDLVCGCYEDPTHGKILCDEHAAAAQALGDALAPSAVPAPGTATREEFERLVTALEDAAILYGVNRGALKRYPPTEARAALLRYEERLRGELADVC